MEKIRRKMDNTVNQQAIEDQEYLDKVAIEVMKSYLDNQKPKGFQHNRQKGKQHGKYHEG